MAATIKWRKILMHPDKEEIIRRLTQAQSLDKIENWLKRKYYDRRKNLRISKKTLQCFRKEFLGLEGTALKELQVKRLQDIAEQDKKRAKTLLKQSPAYNEALLEVTEKIVDKEKRLKQIDNILEAQIIKMTDLVEDDDLRAHKVLIQYIEQWRALVNDWSKIIDKAPDSRVEHSVNITYVRDEIALLKGVIISVLQEMDPDLKGIFLERFESAYDKAIERSEDKKSLNAPSNINSRDVEYAEEQLDS